MQELFELYLSLNYIFLSVISNLCSVSMDNNAVEMQSKSPAEGEKAAPQRTSTPIEDKPPDPPKRGYKIEGLPSEPVSKVKRLRSFPRPEFVFKPENTKTGMTCLKNILIAFNLLIWLFGAALMGLGIWLRVDQASWEIQTGLNMGQFNSAGYIMIATGVIIMIIAIMGCYGAIALNLCLLVMYIIIILIVILLEIAVMALVWTATNNKEVKEEIKSKAKETIQTMSRDEHQRILLDLIQTKLKCCGVDGPDDFTGPEDSRDPLPIPNSCTDPNTGFPYEQGCIDAAVAYFKSKAGILGGVAIAVFVLQIAALVITICIACGIKNSASNLIY